MVGGCCILSETMGIKLQNACRQGAGPGYALLTKGC
jgi:hypothetical protein